MSPSGSGRLLSAALLAALAAWLTAGCATPLERLRARAEQAGLERIELAGRGFTHLAFFRDRPSHSLHVYIEGDGVAWLRPDLPSSDPTPRRPLMFDAMLLDPGAALYLGRPCHYLGVGQPPCSVLQWTHRRYSAAVVASMEAALRNFLRGRRFDRLALFGHSGGGTLAMLLAARLPQTRAVVTVAGNLDIAAWAGLHDYSPLTGSLDPSQQPDLPPRILQWHLSGADDRETPPALALRFAASHPAARVTVHEGQDHACCWLELWPHVLDEIGRSEAD